MTSENFRNDPMFLRNQFNGDGVFEIPKIEKDEIELENIELIGYDKLSEKQTDKVVHFFLDDYKFEVMWNDPEPRIEKLKKYKAVLSPNYSIYTEMPVSVKIYNTFRSRWCGAYLQSKGVKVIPTVAWGEPNTFWFCFDGIAKGSAVAVSTLGVRKEKNLFIQGYNELLRRIKPSTIICYGEPFEEMKGNIITVDYAKTNNLSPKSYDTDPHFITKTYVYYDCDKGMGSASSSEKISLPKNDSQIKHIFGERNGHVADTPQNRQKLIDLANDKSKFQGKDKFGNTWHIEMNEKGNQWWVRFREGTINEGGMNSVPRNWDSDTGLNFNPFK